MYAMLGTRPDLAYPDGLLGRFASDPSGTHWDGVLSVFKYLHHPSELGRSQAQQVFSLHSLQAEMLDDRALNKDEFDEQLLSPRFDLTMDMSSEDENMAIDQRADASDASLDHASVEQEGGAR